MKMKIIIAICILAVLVGAACAVDMYRMSNNEPVVFSTWGRKYAPPIDESSVIPEPPEPQNKQALIGVIEEIHENSILVRCEQAEGYPAGELFSVSVTPENMDPASTFTKGDQVVIYHNGEVAESDPMQINTVYSITTVRGATIETEEFDMSLPQYRDDVVLTEPPELYVIGNETQIEALKGTMSWLYPDENGEPTGIMGDSKHPLLKKEVMPVLSLIPTYYSAFDPLSARLQFGVAPTEIVPDEIFVRCWPEEAWGNADAEGEEIEATINDGNIFIQLKDGNYIYEVFATWNDSGTHSGTVSYSFCTVKPVKCIEG